jgi:hypothetical protein
MHISRSHETLLTIPSMNIEALSVPRTTDDSMLHLSTCCVVRVYRGT